MDLLQDLHLKFLLHLLPHLHRLDYLMKMQNSMADFFAQWILDETAKHNFYSGGPSLGDVFAIYYNEVFSKNPSDNAALTTWLFLATNIYKLQTKNLENQIAELKDQLAKFQTKEENVN